MAGIDWTREALGHLELIRAYIEQFDLRAADRFVARLIAAGESLAGGPNQARPAVDGLRELPTVAPYVIQYEVDHDDVSILHVKHGRQRR